ncbi:MAG TPA: tetracycline resistance MFS efflux pump [Cytophagales bacterium]|nr:tetracycline resistance MFS efflux pump [Cytophagales bacterium]
MKNRTATIWFILLTVLIDVIGVGLIIPIMPQLISQIADVENSQATLYGGLLAAVYSVFQFFFAPILGRISDQYGRRPVLLISLFGLGIDYLFLAFAPNLLWFFVGRIIAGICGASFSTANAYIADISAPEERAKNFGFIGAAFGLGFIVGPLIGGFLGEIGTRVPFMAAAGLTLLNWLYGYFILPESLPKERRRTFTWKGANPFSTVVSLNQYGYILPLILAFFIVVVAGFSIQGVWSFFVTERFGWGPKENGISLSFVGVMVAVVQAGVTGVLVKRLGPVKALYIGLIFNMIGLTLFAFATDGWMVYAIMVPYAFGGIAGPALQGIMSNQIPGDKQGELQGGLTSAQNLAAIIGLPMMAAIFAFFTGDKSPFYFAGAHLALGAVLVAVSIALAMRALRGYTPPSVEGQRSEEPS